MRWARSRLTSLRFTAVFYGIWPNNIPLYLIVAIERVVAYFFDCEGGLVNANGCSDGSSGRGELIANARMKVRYI
jgi:hypothetical protein